MQLFFSESYARAGCEFDTTRKAAWIAERLASEPVPGVTLSEPGPIPTNLLHEVHDREYVESVRNGAPRSLAESQGFDWDSGMWDAVLASTAGMVSATLSALDDGVSGTLSSGLHHARRARGSGFCTFNGLALAAIVAHHRTGGDVLVLDLDAHCGGGTHEILGDEPWARIIDVSVSPFDVYMSSGDNTLDLLHDGTDYLDVIERRLSACGDVSFCVYNAGMDPYERCRIGGLAGITRAMLCAREEMVFEWCRRRGIPVAFAVAGGYVGGRLDKDALVGLHRMTVEAASNT